MNELITLVHNHSYVVGAISIALLYLINWYQRPKRLPPGPRGIPFFGFIPFLGENPAKTADELSKKYGKIMTIRMGGDDAVFLNDYESIYLAFVKNRGTLSGRKELHLESISMGNGLATIDYGPKWKSQRKFGLMTLRGFGVGKKQMENICVEEVHYMNEEIRKHNGKPFDISPLLRNAVSNNICGVALGQRFGYNDEIFTEIMKKMDAKSDGRITAIVNRLIIYAPKLQHIPPFSLVHKQLLKTAHEFLGWLQRLVEEHEKTFDEHNMRDFIDAFLVEMKKENKDDTFTNMQLLHYIKELFVAGTETTSGTISWSVLCMIHYPKAQVKLREEIMKVIGPSGTISMAQKADMPYTNAFIQELFRYRTLGPLGVPHKANDKTELNGFIIPKECPVYANIWAVHNDPKLWKNPEKFLPERFLDEQGNFITSNFVIPFSVGPRHCLGEQLARMEVFVFLVGMVQKFEFLPDPNADQLPNINDGLLALGFHPKRYQVVAKEL